MRIKYSAIILTLIGFFINPTESYGCINESPVACLDVDPDNPIAGLSVTFNATGSYDPDGSGGINGIFKFEWDWENDGTYDHIETYPCDGIATHTFTLAGQKTVKIRVTDGEGARDTTTRTFDVGNVIYVDVDSYPFHDGSTWERAFVDLQDALDAAEDAGVSDNEIWVADGTYKPTDGTDRTISFELVANIGVYGGFEGGSRVGGGETERSQRDWANNETILSGDIGTGGTYTDNSYNVVVGAAGATLDGFTIEKGYAGGTGLDRYGGGIFNYGDAMLIYNCVLKDNYALYGSALYQEGYNCSIYNCEISNNSGDNGLFSAVFIKDYTYVGESKFSGNQCGGLYISGNYARIDSCTFENNQARYGGAINVSGTTGTTYIRECTFCGNDATETATGMGGALRISSSELVEVDRCIFYDNSSADSDSDGGGGAAYCSSSEVKFVSSLFVDNSNSGGYGGAITFKNCVEPEILNCTFYSNDCDMGGAIHIYKNYEYVAHQLDIRNTILWQNDATYGHEISARNIDSYGDLTVDIRNSDLDTTGGDWSYTYGDAYIYHTDRDNVYSDPIFVDEEEVFSDGFAITSNSPCRDEGNNLYIIGYSSDLAGNDRQCNYIVDIGAYEYCD